MHVLPCMSLSFSFLSPHLSLTLTRTVCKSTSTVYNRLWTILRHCRGRRRRREGGGLSTYMGLLTSRRVFCAHCVLPWENSTAFSILPTPQPQAHKLGDRGAGGSSGHTTHGTPPTELCAIYICQVGMYAVATEVSYLTPHTTHHVRQPRHIIETKKNKNKKNNWDRVQ